MGKHLLDLNTSHVKVNPMSTVKETIGGAYLNTSHVKVNLPH